MVLVLEYWMPEINVYSGQLCKPQCLNIEKKLSVRNYCEKAGTLNIDSNNTELF